MSSKSGTEGFRHNEIVYLQEQNRLVLASLERVEAEREEAQELIRACEEKDVQLQGELESVRSKISALVDRLSQDKMEVVAKDEHVKVLSEQNKQMLSLLEMEENKSKAHAEKITDYERKNKALQKISQEFDAFKGRLEKDVSEAKGRCAEILAHVRGQRNLNETLRAAIQNTEAKTRVDIEALAQALQVVDQKNLEYMSRINKQEVKHQQLQSETEVMKEEVDNVRIDIDNLRKQLEGDQEGRANFERARGQIEMTIQALEVQGDTLRKALSTAERANEQLQDENRTAAERSRETADKVYALMDSLRLNQVELKKQEAENHAREKKVISLDRTIQNLSAKLSMETDAKVLAEQERKEAEMESQVLKKKNKMIEEAVTASQQAQDKAEKDIHELSDRVSQLQTQNAYLASRIDGQEEEKNGLREEIKKVGSRTSELCQDNSRLRNEIDKMEEDIAVMTADKAQLVRELDYIKREDLDAGGRQRPILIQSTESDLLEKLQVNEFLFEAQQARNPVPPLIEKVAQLLAMLHDGQMRADQYLADLSKSNALVSALRQRNMALFGRTQMFESFKTRALMKYVMNLLEDKEITDLHLDSLSFGQREITEMIHLLQRYDGLEKIYVISMQDNGLDDDSINLLLQLIFTLPYLRSLDLRGNCIDQEGVKRIEDQLRLMEGVTGVIRTAGKVINVHSGNMLRLTVDLSDQMPKEMLAKEVDFTVRSELAHNDADPFLASNSGTTQSPWVAQKQMSRSLATMRSPQTMQAVADPTSVDLHDASHAPAAPLPGGPPVGLGGPGNVALLNKKAKSKPEAKGARQARRAKAAPPEPLANDYLPQPRAIDKCLNNDFGSRPKLNSEMEPKRSSSQAPTDFANSFARHTVRDLSPSTSARRLAAAVAYGGSLVERSASVPALKKPTRSGIRRA